MKKTTYKKVFGGVIIGIVNGLFGAGGGIVAVPVLQKSEVSDKTAHTSSVAVILPVSVFTLILYLLKGRVSLSAGVPYLLPGLVGAYAGTKLLQKISTIRLRRVFGLLIIFAGARFILK